LAELILKETYERLFETATDTHYLTRNPTLQKDCGILVDEFEFFQDFYTLLVVWDELKILIGDCQLQVRYVRS